MKNRLSRSIKLKSKAKTRTGFSEKINLASILGIYLQKKDCQTVISTYFQHIPHILYTISRSQNFQDWTK